MQTLFENAQPQKAPAAKYFTLLKDCYTPAGNLHASKGVVVKLLKQRGHVMIVKTRNDSPFRIIDSYVAPYTFPSTHTVATPAKPAATKETSRAAYESMKAEVANQHRAILKALATEDGNAWQISQRLSFDKVQTGRRLSELYRKELIMFTGTKAPSDTGRASVVYKITEAGKSQLS